MRPDDSSSCGTHVGGALFIRAEAWAEDDAAAAAETGTLAVRRLDTECGYTVEARALPELKHASETGVRPSGGTARGGSRNTKRACDMLISILM